MSRIFSPEELVLINEKMLSRGMPVTDDGVGYNKADYGACSNYYWGMSDAQIADLSKRLVKYCNTQLGLDKEQMKETHNYYMMKVTGEHDRTDGISLNVTEDGTLISFRYNEVFIKTIKRQPKRQFDADSKQWIVPNQNALKALKALKDVGADVDNAIRYLENHKLIKEMQPKKHKVFLNRNEVEGMTTLRFDYNQEVIDEIRSINKAHRKWVADKKIWKIHSEAFEFLVERLEDVCEFVKE